MIYKTKAIKGVIAIFATIGFVWCLGQLGRILFKTSLSDFIEYQEVERVPNTSGYDAVLIQQNFKGENHYWYYLVILKQDEEFVFDESKQVPVLTFSDPDEFSFEWESETEILVKYSNVDIGTYRNYYRRPLEDVRFSINLEKVESEPVAGGDATR